MGILGLIGRRGSMEDPSTALAAAADDWLGGATTSASGLKVSAGTSLRYAPVWRAVSLIAMDVGKLPMLVYRRQDGGKERTPEHPAYGLLRYAPNGEMSALSFRQTLQAHVLLRGNGYAYILRDGAGRPMELWPLDPDAVTPVRADGRLWYVYRRPDGTSTKLEGGNVLHVRGLGWNGLQGFGVIEMAADSLGMGMGAQRYTAKFFANGARPGVVLEHPEKLSVDAQKALREGWERMHQGLDNAHRTVVLAEGMKASTLSLTAQDAQLLETMRFGILEVANWFGVPPHKLGDASRTSYNSLEQENLAYLAEALDGWLCVWEGEAREKLLTEREKAADSHVVEFVRQALLRTDLRTRGAYYRMALGNRPWMTPDEARAAENMNARGGEAGELRDPTNNFAGGGGGGGDEGTEGGGEGEGSRGAAPGTDEERMGRAREAARQGIQDACTRMARRLATHAQRAARTREDLVDFLAGMEQDHGEVIARAVGPAAVTMAELRGEAPAAVTSAVVREVVGTVRAELVKVYRNTPGKLQGAVEAACSRLLERDWVSLPDGTVGG